MTGFSFTIDVPVRREWQNVDLLVTSVKNCFCAMFANVDGSHTIAMVTGELLENAIKYGSWNGTDESFRLLISGENKTARVVVENPFMETTHVNELQETIAWIKTFPTADEAYRARLLDVAASPHGVSHLGLVRIAYEGGCELEATTRGAVVRVSATMNL